LIVVNLEAETAVRSWQLSLRDNVPAAIELAMRVDAKASGELHENGFAARLYRGHDLALKAGLKTLKVRKEEAYFGCYPSADGAFDPICRSANFRTFGHDPAPLVR
jgi:hypothetical protein